MIQIANKQQNKFHIKIHDIDCIFIPIELFVSHKLMPLEKKIKGSTLGWNVKRKFISYNQIKEIIKTKQL